MHKKYILALSVVCVSLVMANEFVAPKSTKKGPSSSKMKDGIGVSVLNILEYGPKINTQVSVCYLDIVHVGRDIIEQDCLGNCSKATIQEVHQKVHDLEQRFVRLAQETEEILAQSKELIALLAKQK